MYFNIMMKDKRQAKIFLCILIGGKSRFHTNFRKQKEKNDCWNIDDRNKAANC